MTKGEMIKALKQAGVRHQPGSAKKLEHCKTYEIINLYYDSGLNKTETKTETSPAE